MTMNDDPFEVLTTPPPALTGEAAAQILERHYNLGGELEPLTSERDQNFLVTTAEDRRFVLKIANSAEDPAITDFQIGALLHLAKVAPEFPVPRLVRDAEGNDAFDIRAEDGRRHRVRVLTWLDGVPLQHVGRAAGSAATLGGCLARLGQALCGYDHPASGHALLWDLKRAAALRELLGCVANTDLRRICERRLDVFDSTLLPAFDSLRWQVIYNDMNLSNVLVDPDDASVVAGVIDFGDIVRAPLIADVAIACAYLLLDADDPLDDVVRFVSAYHAVEPITETEIELLFDLLLTRSTMTILITHWRATRYPENKSYILRSEPVARRMLTRLSHLPCDDVVDRLRKSVGLA